MVVTAADELFDPSGSGPLWLTVAVFVIEPVVPVTWTTTVRDAVAPEAMAPRFAVT
jgi:hypothetical protein